MVKGHKGVSLHALMSLRASGRAEAAAAEMLTRLLPLGSPAELLRNASPSVLLCPATSVVAQEGQKRWPGRHMGTAAAMFHQAKQHSVVPNLVQGKALNEHWPLYSWLCWAGYKILSWHISHGH